MATVLDLLNGAYRLIGVAQEGEALTAKQAEDGLSALNELLDTWTAQRLMIYTINRCEYNLVAGKGSYNIGPTGDTPAILGPTNSRPIKIEQAYIKVLSSVPNYELELDLLEDEEWANISVKSTPSMLPRKLYNANNYPDTTVYLWPVPTYNNVLVLWTWNQLTAFSSVADTVAFPPGYARALRFNLAIALAPEFGVTPSPVVVQNATESLRIIHKSNSTTQYPACDSATAPRGGAFNWLTGGF